MYKREAKGWAKHLDFMILDLISLAVVMILSYINWFGFLNPFKNSVFIQMFVMILLMDFALLLILNTLKNILKNCYSVISQILRTIFLQFKFSRFPVGFPRT